MHGLRERRNVPGDIIEVEGRSPSATQRIEALASKIESETRQTRLACRFPERQKVRGSSAQTVRADQDSGSLSGGQPTFTGKSGSVRRGPIETHNARFGLLLRTLRKQFRPMRISLLNLLAFCATLATVVAGRLDLAVIQFPEEKTPAQLEGALAKVTLFELTHADRTRSTESYLKGGYVLFAQRFPASPGTGFWTSTRLKNASAEVQGRLEADSVSFSIALTEGVRAGLRTFQKRAYAGTAALPPGVPHLLAIRQARGQSPNVTKGQAKMESYQLTTVVVGQYTH
jgi:hypothetical protein